MEVVFKDDLGTDLKLIYITKAPLRFVRGQKSFPLVTQCLVWSRGLLVGFSQVVKCESDVDDRELAYTLATRKAIHNLPCRYERKKIYAEFLKTLTPKP